MSKLIHILMIPSMVVIVIAELCSGHKHAVAEAIEALKA